MKRIKEWLYKKLTGITRVSSWKQLPFEILFCDYNPEGVYNMIDVDYSVILAEFDFLTYKRHYVIYLKK